MWLRDLVAIDKNKRGASPNIRFETGLFDFCPNALERVVV